MFEIFKKKKGLENDINELNLVAPVSGKTLPLTEVPDPVFAQKMAGDGLAIIPEDDLIVAPVDGELALIFNTKHAFAMKTDNGIEILVHIGLDTVTLNGEGFEQLIQAGKRVKAGTPIIKINREYIKSKDLSLITPVLITNSDNLKSITPLENIETIAGKTVILQYTI